MIEKLQRQSIKADGWIGKNLSIKATSENPKYPICLQGKGWMV